MAKKIELTEELIISEATRLGIVHPGKVRNLKIRNKFNLMRSEGTKYEPCIEKLSKEFFLSEVAIRKILHRTK